FRSIGSLESGVPLIKVSACDRFADPKWRRVPYLDALPELIQRDFEVVQFDAHAKTTSRCTHLVTLDSRPKPEVEHHALFSPTSLSQGLEPRADATHPFVRRTAPRSTASSFASVVFPAAGNPQVRISRAFS